MTAVFPTRLPVPITAIDGQLERLEVGRIEAKVGADVRQPGCERPRRPAEPLGRAEHGLVGEVDDELGAAEVVDERHAVVRAVAQLLGAADEDRADPVVRQRGERVADDRRRSAPRR